MVVDRIFSFVDEIRCEDKAFLLGAIGRRFATDTIADGVNMLGGSFKMFIDGDTGGFVFDFGVF